MTSHDTPDLATRANAGEPAYIRALAVTAAFFVLFISMSFFRVRDYADKTVDFQITLKLMAIGLSLAIPIAAIVANRLAITHRVILIWLVFLLSFVLSSSYAPLVRVSFIDSLAFVGCLLFCLWMTTRFGETSVVTLFVLSVSLVSVISLVVYYVDPDLGRMHAWLGSEFGENNRIKGIAGSPNGLGSMTSISLVLSLLYFRRLVPSWRPAVLAAAVPTFVCLIMTDNRMSFLSLIVCAMLFFVCKGNRAANLLLVAMVVAGLLLVVLSAPDKFLGAMARSGEASEITSGTGRAAIWAVVLEHIAARPLMGYGYAAATSILPLDPRLFSVAAHCHNMYLEVMFSGGAMSFTLFVIALVLTLYEGLRWNCFEPVVVVLFFLLRGFTEPSPFSSMPSFAGYAFFLSVVLIASRARRAESDSRAVFARRAAGSLARCRANLRGASAAA